MPRLLLAPDKFKGTLTAAEVALHLAVGVRGELPGVDVTVVPIADGGDGTLAAAVAREMRDAGGESTPGAALLRAVEAAGALVVEHGPRRRPGDVNELSDEPAPPA